MSQRNGCQLSLYLTSPKNKKLPHLYLSVQEWGSVNCTAHVREFLRPRNFLPGIVVEFAVNFDFFTIQMIGIVRSRQLIRITQV